MKNLLTILSIMWGVAGNAQVDSAIIFHGVNPMLADSGYILDISDSTLGGSGTIIWDNGWQPTPLQPFETYYDTVKVNMLVGENTDIIGSPFGSAFTMRGYEVYKHSYHKGRGYYWEMGDIQMYDADSHEKDFVCYLWYDKTYFPKHIIVWQTK